MVQRPYQRVGIACRRELPLPTPVAAALSPGALRAERRRDGAARPRTPAQGPDRGHLLCPNLRIGPPSDLYVEQRRHGGAGAAARDQRRRAPAAAGRWSCAASATAGARMRVNQGIYRAGGGSRVFRTDAHAALHRRRRLLRRLLLEGPPARSASSCWSARRAPPAAAPGPHRARSSSTACATSSGPSPGRRSPATATTPAATRTRTASGSRLGTSVGWSDIYPADYDQQWINVSGLRGCFAFVMTGRPAEPALRVERARQHARAGSSASPSTRGPSTAEAGQPSASASPLAGRGRPRAGSPRSPSDVDRGRCRRRSRAGRSARRRRSPGRRRRRSPPGRPRSATAPARRCGWPRSGTSGTSRRPAGRRSGGRRGARGPRGRRAGSGARGWRRPGSPGPGSSAPTASRVRGPRLVDQLAHRQRREVHDRRGLAVVAALDPVDALDRRRVERVAGEPVEAVGGKDRDAAAGDAALERGARRGRPVALDRDDLGSPARPRRPARSRPGRGGPRSRRSRRRRSSAGDRVRLAGPDLQRERSVALCPHAGDACRARPGEQAADRVEAVGAGEQRLARLPLGDLGLQRGPVGLGDVGEVGDDQVEAPRPRAPSPSRKRTRSASPSALGVGARHLQRAGRGVGRGHLARRAARRRSPARPRPSRCRRRARARAAARAPARPAARSPAAGSAPARSTASSIRRKPLRPRM